MIDCHVLSVLGFFLPNMCHNRRAWKNRGRRNKLPTTCMLQGKRWLHEESYLLNLMRLKGARHTAQALQKKVIIHFLGYETFLCVFLKILFFITYYLLVHFPLVLNLCTYFQSVQISVLPIIFFFQYYANFFFF